MRNKRKRDELNIIEDAIAHLNGYLLIIETRTGYPAVAVQNTLLSLRDMERRLIEELKK